MTVAKVTQSILPKGYVVVEVTQTAVFTFHLFLFKDYF